MLDNPLIHPQLAETHAFRTDVIDGLSRRQKRLSARWFYDLRGSQLFEDITQLDAYYPTRTEIALLQAVRDEICDHVTGPISVVEFGAGSVKKTPLLLKGLDDLAAYVPIDISAEFLASSVQALRRDMPDLPIHAVYGDFTDLTPLPAIAGSRNLGFFPGSTIGNLTRAEAVAFLSNARRILKRGSQFLIGIDMIKPVEVLLRAYNDEDGVTAAFNLNLLARINRELGGDFDPTAFAHEAIWNPAETRIEMHLRSTVDQDVRIGEHIFTFHSGETIHTENSHKYSRDGFAHMAAEAGWVIQAQWLDTDMPYGLYLMMPQPD
ncbi:MAG: L-histidine N(alpha)-methyltransferase [Asticcacaulis sp.]